MQPVAPTDQEVNCMFYPPSLLDPTPTPEPVPIYDTPIADRQPVRALAWGIARAALRRPRPEACPGPRPESSF
jgi:hypothetical protein